MLGIFVILVDVSWFLIKLWGKDAQIEIGKTYHD